MERDEPPAAQPAAERELAGALAARFTRIVRELLRESGVPGLSRTALSVLATLRDCGPCRISDLARSERVAQPSMTTLVSRLEARGLARRQDDPCDRRVVNVAITDVGRAELARLTEARARVLAERLARLPADERGALTAALPALDALLAVASDSG